MKGVIDMANGKECCNNCSHLYEEYGWKLCMRNEVTMDDIHNEKCEEYLREVVVEWEGGE
jgi:hypothetical protein